MHEPISGGFYTPVALRFRYGSMANFGYEKAPTPRHVRASSLAAVDCPTTHTALGAFYLSGVTLSSRYRRATGIWRCLGVAQR